MPAASSTRAVALLTLGIIDGCTQPISISTLRGCWRVGQRCARAGAGAATLAFRTGGRKERKAWPTFIAGAKSGDVRPSFKDQRVACSAAGRGTRSSTMRRPISTRLPYCTPEGQVVSQLRQVRQRSRWSWVARVGAWPSSTCLMR